MVIVTIAVPFVSHPSRIGLESAPAAWNSAGLAERLAPFAQHGIWVTLSPPENAANEMNKHRAVTQQLKETTTKVRKAGALPLVLGGDPFISALGTLAGLQQVELEIVREDGDWRVRRAEHRPALQD